MLYADTSSAGGFPPEPDLSLADAPPAVVAPEPLVSGGVDQPAGVIAVSAESLGFDGLLMTYARDWYDTYHFNPAPLSLGLFKGNSTASVELWNAYRVPADITTATFDTGIGLASDLTVPQTLSPLGSVVFTITFGVNAPFVLDDAYRVTIAGVEVALRITGIQTILLDWPPDWSDPIEDRLTYNTEVITSVAGREQRRALDADPRWVRGFSVHIPPAGVATLSRWMNRVVVAPDPVRWCRLAVAAPAAATTLTVDTVPPWVGEKNTIVLGDEIFSVAGVVGNDIFLATPTKNAHAAGTPVHLGLPSRFAGKTTTTWRSDALQTARLTLNVEPGAVSVPRPPAAATYDGLDVLSEEPNWRTDVTNEWLSIDPLVNFGRGRWSMVLLSDIVRRVVRAGWTGIGRERVQALEDFFRRQYGMARTFWAPSFTVDFPPPYDPVPGTYLLQFAAPDLARDFADDPTHRAIVLRGAGGNVMYTRVSGWATTADGLAVATLLDPIPPWPLRRVEWLYHARMASDTLTIKWLSDEVADVAFTYQTLRID